MNYSKILKYDVANTNDISCTLFVSGCTNNCTGCFNKPLQDFNYGNKWTKEIEDKFIEYCKNPNVHCIAILGGEPMQQGNDMYYLVKRLKEEVDKPIWIWTGCLFENLLKYQDTAKVLQYTDILIDGRFELSKKDLKLKHRGSTNQRIIDVKNSLKSNKVIEIDQDEL